MKLPNHVPLTCAPYGYLSGAHRPMIEFYLVFLALCFEPWPNFGTDDYMGGGWPIES